MEQFLKTYNCTMGFFAYFEVEAIAMHTPSGDSLNDYIREHQSELNELSTSGDDEEENQGPKPLRQKNTTTICYTHSNTPQIDLASKKFEQQQITYTKSDHFVIVKEQEQQVREILQVFNVVTVPIEYQGENIGVGVCFNKIDTPTKTTTKPKNMPQDFLFTLSVALNNSRLVRLCDQHRKQINRFKIERNLNRIGQANLSHEMKTMVFGIVGNIDALYDSELDQTQLAYLDTIYKCVVKLLSYQMDFIEYSKYALGKYKAKTDESIVVRSIVHSCVQTFVPQIQEKQLAVDICVGANVPVTISSDQNMYTRVLENLLSNAVKYTTEGAIGVVVKATTDEITFEVTDTGCGIPKDQLSLIFNPYYRVSNDHSEGTGLGLSIVKTIVNHLKGKIAVASDKGSTRFTITLPYQPNVFVPLVQDQELSTTIYKKNVLIYLHANKKCKESLMKFYQSLGTYVYWTLSRNECDLFLQDDNIEFDLLITDDPTVTQFAHTILVCEDCGNAEALSSCTSFVLIVNNCDLTTMRYATQYALVDRKVDFETMTIQKRRQSEYGITKAKSATTKTLKVLIVEHEKICQDVLLYQLKKNGITAVKVLSDGLNLVSELRSFVPDLLFMDINMPNRNGFELVKDVKAANLPNRPILVAVTARKDKTTILSQFDEYLSKMSLLDDLEKLLSKLAK